MDRRRLVQLIGVGATVGIAGCSSDNSEASGGDGGSDSTDTTANTDTDTDTETETETETETATETAEPAEFELVEYNIPETVEIGEAVTFEITVRNTGGQTDDFVAPLYYRTPDTDWQEGGDWTFTDVQPGESVTAETAEPIVFDYIQRYEYGLGDFSETAVLQTVSAKVAWGNEYTTPAGYRIRADTPTLQDSYEYEDYQENTEDAEPDNGGQWAFINVWVKNETGQANYSPLSNDFGLLYENSQSDAQTLFVNEPINKGDAFDGGELQPGVERSGWIAFAIPSEMQLNELTLAWSQDTFEGQIAANWGVF
jgi:hypothetical protein